MKSQNKITVTKKNDGERLDVFLAKELEVSRSQIQKMIEAEQVFVNKKLPKKAGDNLRVGYTIVILSKAKDPSRSDKRDSSAMPQNDKVKIVAETPDYIVVDKPTGMLAHPTMAGEKNTLANFIIKKYPEIKKVGDLPAGRQETNVRPGIVHRLDKEASGLMVIARTQKMFNHLKEQFKNRVIEKEYYALAHGQVARDWGEIDFPIARSETADRMAARPMSVTVGARHALPLHDNEKEAKTEFLVEKKFINFTLLRVKIHTGRMHQIRAHFLAYNHPLVGDPLYFQKKQKRTWDEKLGRLFLHSAKLGFTDLNGEKQIFESPLPNELSNFLKLLK